MISVRAVLLWCGLRETGKGNLEKENIEKFLRIFAARGAEKKWKWHVIKLRKILGYIFVYKEENTFCSTSLY